ncbi:hypothetical protein [Falsiphaeobacter marinintestinus]|uniref:hypothetical protein n=1 Tax=Falsiphaeobacter marinintestinus TaxID=1492905 RepID=UPI0011B6FFB9|nr:hypothetical protein [Phaeobacter marinintestinus]
MLIRQNAKGALTLYEILALSDDFVSTLFLDADRSAGSEYDFKTAQHGGGFAVSEDSPLYPERA